MKTHKAMRLIHHWGSLFVAVPLVIMIGAGILLMLKKEVEWIQPSTITGSAPRDFPAHSIETLYRAVKTQVPGFPPFGDLSRVDIKASKGVVKFITKAGLEVQVDMATTNVLHIAERQSDWLEQLHDGSFFSDTIKLFVFLPSGILLLILWLTGVYLFIITEYKKNKSRQNRKRTLNSD